jgi:hypothetical protein
LEKSRSQCCPTTGDSVTSDTVACSSALVLDMFYARIIDKLNVNIRAILGVDANAICEELTKALRYDAPSDRK